MATASDRKDGAATALPFSFAPALMASFFAGLSITYSQGHYSEPAMTMVVMALFTTAWCFVGLLRKEAPVIEIGSFWLGLIWSALFAMVWTAWNDPAIIMYRYKEWQLGPPTQVIALLLLVTYCRSCARRRASLTFFAKLASRLLPYCWS